MPNIEHLSSIPVPAEVSSEIITNAIDATGLASLVNIQPATSGEAIQTYNLEYAKARFHNPTTETKTPSDLTANLLEVRMYDFYQIYKVKDTTDRAVPQVIAQMQRDLPRVLGATLQQAVFPVANLVAGNPWVGADGNSTVFGAAVEEDLSKASGWLDATSVKGYKGMLLNDLAKDSVQNALVEGSTQNVLTFGVDDGTLLRGKPVYFTDLDNTALTDIAGISGDWSKAVLFVDDSLSMNVVDSSTSYQMMLEDARTYKVKWRVGFGVTDRSRFKVFKQKAPTAGSK